MAREYGVPIDIRELAADPNVPASGYKRLYAKSGGLYFRDGSAVWDLVKSGNSSLLDIEDEFLRSGNESGEIGQLGWAQQSTPTNTEIAAVANHPGIVRTATTTTSGDFAALSLNAGAVGAILPTDVELYIFIVRPITTASQILRIGLMDTITAATQVNGVYFEHNTASSANWRTVTRAANVETANSTAIAVTANNWYYLSTLRVSNGNWLFYLNASLQFTHSTNLPTAAVQPMVMASTLSAAPKSVDTDYFRLRSVTFGQRWT